MTHWLPYIPHPFSIGISIANIKFAFYLEGQNWLPNTGWAIAHPAHPPFIPLTWCKLTYLTEKTYNEFSVFCYCFLLNEETFWLLFWDFCTQQMLSLYLDEHFIIIDKVEIFLEQREVAFLSPSKICEILNSLLKFKFSQILLGGVCVSVYFLPIF